MEYDKLYLGTAKQALSSDYEQHYARPDAIEPKKYAAIPPPGVMCPEGTSRMAVRPVEEEPPPPGANVEKWAKLQAIRRKREEVQARSMTSKQRKNLQNSIVHKVVSSVTESELEEMGISHLAKRRNAPQQKKGPETSIGLQVLKEQEEVMRKLKPFMNVNSHLKSAHDSYGPKTDLEKRIEQAIEKGDHALALQLNDELAKAIAAKQIVTAVKAKRYMEESEAELKRHRPQKKHLKWTFDSKARWEQKGNM